MNTKAPHPPRFNADIHLRFSYNGWELITTVSGHVTTTKLTPERVLDICRVFESPNLEEKVRETFAADAEYKRMKVEEQRERLPRVVSDESSRLQQAEKDYKKAQEVADHLKEVPLGIDWAPNA